MAPTQVWKRPIISRIHVTIAIQIGRFYLADLEDWQVSDVSVAVATTVQQSGYSSRER